MVPVLTNKILQIKCECTAFQVLFVPKIEAKMQKQENDDDVLPLVNNITAFLCPLCDPTDFHS